MQQVAHIGIAAPCCEIRPDQQRLYQLCQMILRINIKLKAHV